MERIDNKISPARQRFNSMGDTVCTLQQKTLAKELGVNTTTLQRWLKENSYTTIKNRQDVEIELNETQKSVIEGSLLGDGTIDQYKFDNKGGTNRNSLLRIKHCIAQADYLKHKAELLGDIVISIKDLKSRREEKEHLAIELYTKRNKVFSDLRNVWYKQGSRQVPEEVVLNELSTAIWFMDNGSAEPCGYSIACQSLTIQSIELLRSKLFDLGIDTNSWACGTIYIPTRSAKEFKSFIERHIITEMRYKLGSR